MEDRDSETAEDNKIPEDSRDKGTKKKSSGIKVPYLTVPLENIQPVLHLLV